MICFTFRMGEKQDWASFWGCLTAWLWGLMLKANIGLYPLFALAYLLLKKYDLRLLVRQCLTLGAVTLCILVPWTVRNWHHFGAFIPLTYGSGNPTLLGTYQGAGFPPDGELDYDTHVEQAARDQYADYYGPDGAPLPQFERYINLQKDGLKARYRQQVWWETYPLSMLGSYLVAKPQNMINSVFYWDEILDTPKSWLLILQRVDLWLCIFTVAAALHLKKQRLPVLFLAGTYLCNIYIYAMTFSFDRYNAGLMPLRFILVGIGLDLMIRLPARWIREAPSE